MPIIKINDTTCVLGKKHYANGRLALTAIDMSDGMPYATLTKNLVNEVIADDEAFIDANNVPTAERALRAANVIGAEPIRYARSGYVEYPLYKILV